MKEQLIERRENLVKMIAKIDRAIKILDDNPHVEQMLEVSLAIQGIDINPMMPRY